MTSIYHIAREALVDEARGSGIYAPRELDRDGFIHCSYGRQLRLVASRSWAQDSWVLLEIDLARVAEQLVDENLEGGEDLFPHLYGKLPVSAIISIRPLVRDGQTGQLTLPEDVSRPSLEG